MSPVERAVPRKQAVVVMIKAFRYPKSQSCDLGYLVTNISKFNIEIHQFIRSAFIILPVT